MEQFANVLGCGVIYFLIVYWFVIRRKAEPIIPWAVCIIAQVVCFVFFQDIKNFFLSFLSYSLAMPLASLLAFVGNILLIFAMFGPVLDLIENNNRIEERTETEFFVAPIPKAMSGNAEQIKTEKKNDEGDITIAFIEKMIADGRKDEALKYLKMLAYYGKDEQTREEASKMMAELNTVRE